MLIALPLLLIPVALYNIVILFGATGGGGMAQADAILRDPIFSVPMTSGANWNVGVGDLILFLSLILLFFELLKSTRQTTKTISDRA